MQHESNLTIFSETQRTEALRQFHMIRPFLEDGVPLTRIATEHQLPIRTLRRWVQRYKAQGLVGLIKPERKDKGKRRVAFPQMQQLIEGLSLQRPQRAIANLQREVEQIAKEQGWKIPSYSTIERIIQEIDPALTMFAPQGSKAYREEFRSLICSTDDKQPLQMRCGRLTTPH